MPTIWGQTLAGLGPPAVMKMMNDLLYYRFDSRYVKCPNSIIVQLSLSGLTVRFFLCLMCIDVCQNNDRYRLGCVWSKISNFFNYSLYNDNNSCIGWLHYRTSLGYILDLPSFTAHVKIWRFDMTHLMLSVYCCTLCITHFSFLHCTVLKSAFFPDLED